MVYAAITTTWCVAAFVLGAAARRGALEVSGLHLAATNAACAAAFFAGASILRRRGGTGVRSLEYLVAAAVTCAVGATAFVGVHLSHAPVHLGIALSHLFFAGALCVGVMLTERASLILGLGFPLALAFPSWAIEASALAYTAAVVTLAVLARRRALRPESTA